MIAELKSLQEIIKVLTWLSTLGLSEIKDVKLEAQDLVAELSKSLVNIWDIVRTICDIEEDALTKETFEDVHDYFLQFYFGDWNISQARTHCGNVERIVRRITFRIPKFLHTDLGKWNEADAKLLEIVDRDGDILSDYDSIVMRIDSQMRNIKENFDNGDTKKAIAEYGNLKSAFENDIRFLRDGVKEMEKALENINRVMG